MSYSNFEDSIVNKYVGGIIGTQVVYGGGRY